MRPRIRVLFLVGAMAAASLWLVPASEGDTTAPIWTCRASVGYLNAPGQDPGRLEPVVANGGTSPATINRAQCVDDDAGFPPIVIGGEPGDPGVISIQGPFARTRVNGDTPADDLGEARDQTVTGAGGVAKVRIASADNSFALEADVADAATSGRCVNGAPVLEGNSRVVRLSLNGNNIPVQDALIPIVNGINGSPLVMLLRIDLNEVVTSGDANSAEQSRTQRALHVQLLKTDPAQPPALEAVVGEAIVGRSGAVCGPPLSCPDGFVEVGRAPDGSVQCQRVLQEPCEPPAERRPDGTCIRVIVVDNPPDVGCPPGQTRDINGICRVEPRSRCSRGRFGNPLLGTNRSDRITGTNRPDRILSLGGRDRVSGGRGNDCLEGGSGNDNLDGSNNNDVMFGGSGRDILNGGTGRDSLRGEAGIDKLTGGSGNDRMDGGSGRDRLSGGFGRDTLIGGPGRDFIDDGNGADRVYAGPGNDGINVATAGKGRDFVNCGPGFDTVRANTRDRLINCERVLVTSQSRGRRR